MTDEELREAVKLIQGFARAANPPDCECSEAMELLVNLAQSYLSASKEFPEEKIISISNSAEDYDTGYNEARHLCILAHMKQKEGWGRVLSEADCKLILKKISSYWTILEQDVGRELRVIPADEKQVIQAIHALMERGE